MNPSEPRRGTVLERLLLFGLYAVPWTVPWTVAGVHIAVGIAAAAGLAMGFFERRWPVRGTVADRAWVAFALASLLSTARAATSLASLTPLKKFLLVPLLHLAAGSLATPRRARAALRSVVGAMAVTALVASVHFLLVPHAPDERLRSTGHYMTFAGLLLLALPPCAGAAVGARGRVRMVYLAATVVLAVALVLGFSRSAWIGAVVAGTAMLLRARPRLVWLVPVAVLAGLLLAPARYRERALASFDPSHPQNVDRVELWRIGAAIWRDHPWTGVGPSDLGPWVKRYQTQPLHQAHGHLHDNWIHIAATLGTAGLLAFLWLTIDLGRLAWAAGRATASPELRGLGQGIWGSYLGFHVMGVFEWNFGDVEVTIALLFLLGAGLAAAWAVPPEPGTLRNGAGPTLDGPRG